MIYKLTKHFNSFTQPSTLMSQALLRTQSKAAKGKNSRVKNNQKWNTYSKISHFIALESQINSLIYSFFKKLYVITSKPVYCISNKEITVKFLYFIPDRLLSTAKTLAAPTLIASQPLQEGSLPLKVGTASKQEAVPTFKGREAVQSPLVISRIQFLSMLLSKWLNMNIRVEATRVKHPQFDSNIFAEYLGIKSFSWSYSKMKKAVRILSIKGPFLTAPIVLSTAPASTAKAGRTQPTATATVTALAATAAGAGKVGTQEAVGMEAGSRAASPRFMSGLTGLSLKVSGRLHKQRIVPKRTVKRTHKGPSAASSMMAVQTATFTGKNKKGSYSIKIQTGHSLHL